MLPMCSVSICSSRRYGPRGRLGTSTMLWWCKVPRLEAQATPGRAAATRAIVPGSIVGLLEGSPNGPRLAIIAAM